MNGIIYRLAALDLILRMTASSFGSTNAVPSALPGTWQITTNAVGASMQKAIILDYHTEIPRGMFRQIVEEADSLWPTFEPIAERSGLTLAIIEAHAPETTPPQTSISVLFQKSPKGSWQHVGTHEVEGLTTNTSCASSQPKQQP